MGRRIIDHTTDLTVRSDDFLIKDSSTNGTKKITPEAFAEYTNGQMKETVSSLTEATSLNDNDLLYVVTPASPNVAKKVKKSTLKSEMKPSDYTGATSSTNGANGLVPQPTTSDVDRFLKGDGTWGDISYAVGEASGSIATFSDGSPLPMCSLKAYIEPQQDLHDYDSPWVGGSGKNKANPDLLLNGYTNPSNRKYDNTTMAKTQFVKTEGLSTITISATNGNRCYVCYYNDIPNVGDEASTDVTQVATSLPQTITVDSSYTYVAIQVCYNPSGANVSNVQVESGNQATTFAPYSNICPISGWDECNVTRCGENLFDKATITENKIINNNTGEETTSYGRFSSDYIKVNSSTDYYASNVIKSAQWYCAFYYDKNKNYLSCGELSSTGDIASGVITTPSNCNYVRLVGVTTYKDDVSFVVGNQPPTTYEPYNGHTYTIQFTDGSNPLTVYGGYVDIVSGVLVVDRGYALFDGSDDEHWTMSTSQQYMGNAYIDLSNCKNNSSGICNEGLVVPLNRFQYGECCIATATLNVWFFNTSTTLSDFRAYLAQNPLQLVYELATPQTYQLTAQQVKSLLGVNNVWADTGDVDVHYVRDLTITIDDILSRLEALES